MSVFELVGPGLGHIHVGTPRGHYTPERIGSDPGFVGSSHILTAKLDRGFDPFAPIRSSFAYTARAEYRMLSLQLPGRPFLARRVVEFLELLLQRAEFLVGQVLQMYQPRTRGAHRSDQFVQLQMNGLGSLFCVLWIRNTRQLVINTGTTVITFLIRCRNNGNRGR